MGTEIAGSTAAELGVAALCFAAFCLGALLSAIALSADAGGLAHAAGGAVAGKLSPPFLFALTAPGLVASRSVSWSRKSDSSRPFEVSNWYPERDGLESAYHAVTFVLTRTTEPPDGAETTSTVD